MMLTHEQIRPIKAIFSNQFLSRPNISGIDINYVTVKAVQTEELGIVVHVKKKKSISEIPQGELLPTLFQGIRVDVVESNPQFLNDLPMPEMTLDQVKERPLEGGISIGTMMDNGWGTLGSIITRQQRYFIVTCAHVLSYGLTDTRQPGGSQETSGYENIVAETKYWGVQSSQAVNVDLALAEIHPNVSYNVDRLRGIGNILEWGSFIKNQLVTKSGATTGVTHGKVLSVDFDIVLTRYPGIPQITFRNQLLIQSLGLDLFANCGDSGSIVMSDDNRNCAGGLIFAGDPTTGYFCAHPMGDVERAISAWLAGE